MPLLLRDGKLLIRGGKLALDPRCCCAPGCAYRVQVTINWDNNADLDLYGTVDSAWPAYYGNRSSNGLNLSVDAHPVCNADPAAPEEIAGDFTAGHVFHFWYDQYSACQPETAPTTHHITITNTGTTPICVNGTTVAPGDTWESDALAYAGYATGSSPGFTYGTRVNVICGTCP